MELGRVKFRKFRLQLDRRKTGKLNLIVVFDSDNPEDPELTWMPRLRDVQKIVGGLYKVFEFNQKVEPADPHRFLMETIATTAKRLSDLLVKV